MNQHRLINLMRQTVERCELDLRGLTVLTEAASGSYIVTPVLAALAGAERVIAISKTTRHGAYEDVVEATKQLSALSGIPGRIEFFSTQSRELISAADIITNSGHVRPIDADFVGFMKASSVISLMYESWEYRQEDIDLDACNKRDILVGATNERHPNIDVFSYLGIMALKQMLDSGIALLHNTIVLICDNPFKEYIIKPLQAIGIQVFAYDDWSYIRNHNDIDVIVVASTPANGSILDETAASYISGYFPGIQVMQFWGDIDRSIMQKHNIFCWPPDPPHKGHMGILPSAIGPEPIVRLQAGGLKVGEILARARQLGNNSAACKTILKDSGYGECI